jgi:hypothetical protein
LYARYADARYAVTYAYENAPARASALPVDNQTYKSGDEVTIAST